MKKRFLSILLAVVMVFTAIPAAYADEADTVYISVSLDGQFINDKNGSAIAYTGIPLEMIAAVDLSEYGLEEYLYDADGDGTYEITALQLAIYVHEELYSGDFTVLAGFAFYMGRLPKQPWVMALFGFLTVVFWIGPLLDCSHVFLMVPRINPSVLAASFISGFPINVSQGVSTVLVMLLFGKPLLEKLDRVKLKYGMMEEDDGI